MRPSARSYVDGPPPPPPSTWFRSTPPTSLQPPLAPTGAQFDYDGVHPYHNHHYDTFVAGPPPQIPHSTSSRYPPTLAPSTDEYYAVDSTGTPYIVRPSSAYTGRLRIAPPPPSSRHRFHYQHEGHSSSSPSSASAYHHHHHHDQPSSRYYPHSSMEGPPIGAQRPPSMSSSARFEYDDGHFTSIRQSYHSEWPHTFQLHPLDSRAKRLGEENEGGGPAAYSLTRPDMTAGRGEPPSTSAIAEKGEVRIEKIQKQTISNTTNQVNVKEVADDGRNVLSPTKRARLNSSSKQIALDINSTLEVQRNASNAIEGQFDDASEDEDEQPLTPSAATTTNSKQPTTDSTSRSTGEEKSRVPADVTKESESKHNKDKASSTTSTTLPEHDENQSNSSEQKKDSTRKSSPEKSSKGISSSKEQIGGKLVETEAFPRSTIGTSRSRKVAKAFSHDTETPFYPGGHGNDDYQYHSSRHQHGAARSHSTGYPSYPPTKSSISHSVHRQSPPPLMAGAAFITPPHSHLASVSKALFHAKPRPAPPLRDVSCSDYSLPPPPPPPPVATGISSNSSSNVAPHFRTLYYEHQDVEGPPGPPSRYVSVSQGSSLIPPTSVRSLKSLSRDDLYPPGSAFSRSTTAAENEAYYRSIHDSSSAHPHDFMDHPTNHDMIYPRITSSSTGGVTFPNPNPRHKDDPARQGSSATPVDPETTASYIAVLNENDVLLGRGKGVNDYIGNRKFRNCIKSHRQEYLGSSRGDKTQIARHIVDYVEGLDPPGRFLKKVPNTRYWITVERQVALEKTSQALREGSPKSVRTEINGRKRER